MSLFHSPVQGVATLAAAKPSVAAYGDSANVFGGISNPTGARDTIFSRMDG